MTTGTVTADGRARVLADGNEIPLLGLGVWQVPPGPDTENSVRWALELGYRHVDTAQAYGNEESVGRALRDSGVPREEVFITTKFFPGRKDPEAEARRSLERLGVDHVDLYIVHWPQGGPTWAWPGMEGARERGYARSIGVSNFSVSELDELMSVARTAPVVNQVQFSPFEYRRKLLEACVQRGVALEAYSPLGTGRHLSDGRVGQIAARQGGRRPRSFCGGACSGISWSSRSRRIATESGRTPRSSTSRCPRRTWPHSTRSIKRAAPTPPSSAPGGDAPMSRTIEVPEYEVHDEVRIDPARTALVVVDMQNDFVREGGSLRGPDAEATIPAIRGLLQLARAQGMRVVFSQDTHRDGDPEWKIWPEHCREGELGLGDRRRARAGAGRDRAAQGALRRLLRHAPGPPAAAVGHRHARDLRHRGQHLRPLHGGERSAALVRRRDPPRRRLGAGPVRPRVLAAPDGVPVRRPRDDRGRRACLTAVSRT